MTSIFPLWRRIRNCAPSYRLPGRKIVYTNGSEPYAKRVLEARGLTGIFDAIYGIEHADFKPKPIAQAFDIILKKKTGLPPITRQCSRMMPATSKSPMPLA